MAITTLLFDVNETLLDLAPVKESLKTNLNFDDTTIKLWFNTLLQYSLVDTVSGKYHDFGDIGAAVLQMVSGLQGHNLSREKAKEILKPMKALSPHPEVPEGLSRLKAAGYRLVAFTNGGKDTLAHQMDHAGLDESFDVLLSVEGAGKFKPHTEAYLWATKQLEAAPGECMMVAAHGWDVAGAMRAGLKTCFVNRPGQQLYPLADQPDFIVSGIDRLAESLK